MSSKKYRMLQVLMSLIIAWIISLSFVLLIKPKSKGIDMKSYIAFSYQ